jgi:3-deoxy-7-phosphoheptulonate synthase/chorismate mutase
MAHGVPVTEEETRADELVVLRSRLDVINLQMLRMLEARGVIVHEIMAVKQERGVPAYDAKREREMMNAILRHMGDVYPCAAIESIFKTIFAASRALGR